MKKILLFLVIALLSISAMAEDTEKESPWSFSGEVQAQSFVGDSDYFNTNDRWASEFKFMSELELNGKYKPSKAWEFNATGVVGNYLNTLELDPYYKKSTVSAHLYYLNGKYTDKKAGEITAGSFGFKVNPYIFERVSNDDYFVNNRTQDGNYPITGVNWKNTIDKFSYNLWYGKMGKNGFDDENLYWYSCDFALNGGYLNETYGGQLGYKFGTVALDGTYMELKSGENDDKAKLYGGTIKIPNKIVDIDANYYVQDTTAVNLYNEKIDKSSIWDINLTKNFGKLDTKLSYLYIGEYYNAPGAWVLHTGNGAGLKGFVFKTSYNFFDNFKVYGYIQKGKCFQPTIEGDVLKTNLGVNYQMDEKANFDLSWRYKYKLFDLTNQSTLHDYFMLKFNYDISKSMKFMLGYEYDHGKIQSEKYSNGIVFSQIRYSF